MTRRTEMGVRILGALAASVVGTQAVMAQEPAAEIDADEVRVFSTTTPEGREDTFVFYSNAAPITPFGGRVDIIAGMGTVPGAVVTGKPYSADAVTESIQMLADGNRITQRNEARTYRDGQGRTRREQTLGGLGVWQAANEPATTITIHDPVGGTTFMMNPGTATAHAIRPFALTTAMHAAGAEMIAGTPAIPPGAAAGGVVAFPPMAAARAPFPLGEAVTEDLGEQILEGVLARGSRETRTIPAGAIGNEQPIDIVSERWYSDELEADVLRRNVDPRFGETTYQLVNVVLGEPSADLFVVPESYELQTEENARFEFKLQRPEPGSAAVR